METKDNKQALTDLSAYIIDALKAEKFYIAYAVFQSLIAKINGRGQELSSYKVNEDGFLIYSNEG